MSDQIRNSTIARVEGIIRYHFNNPNLCWEAVQVAGSGVYRIDGRDTTKGNQNLAVLGNTTMKTSMADAWIDTNTIKEHWQNRCSTVLSVANLAQVGYSSGLDSCLYKNPLNPPPTSDKLAAALVKAVCGAVYKDSGLGSLADVMQVLGLTLVMFLFILPLL